MLLRLVYFVFCFFCLACVGIAKEDASLHQSRLKARAFYYETLLKQDSISKQERLRAMDSLLAVYSEQGRTEDLFRLQKEVVSYLQTDGTLIEALQVCRSYVVKLQGKAVWQAEDSLQYVELELKMGLLSIAAGLYDDGASYFLDLLKRNPPDWCIARAYSCLGYIFMMNNRLEKSMEYHRKAVACYQAMEDGPLKQEQGAFVFDHLAGLYYVQEKYDSAIWCLEQAVRCSDEGSVKSLYSYHNMALMYEALGEYRKAEEYLQKTMHLAAQSKATYLQAVAMQNLASLYGIWGRLEQAEELFKETLELASKMHFNDLVANTMISYADILFRLGDCEGFREYYTAGVARRDSMTGGANQEKIDLLNYQYESYKLESERKILEQDLALTSLANQKKTIVVIGLVFVLLLGSFYMVRLVKTIQRQTQENKTMNQQMDSIRLEMEKQETDSRKLLQDSIERKDRELASRALYMVRVNDVLQQSILALDRLEHCDAKERKRQIEAIKSDISNLNGNISGWKEFRFYFEQIHQGFYNRLLAEVPNLSPIEQRLCALLASNLTQKEIADISNRSVRTVETMIYRIRKKFKLPSEIKMSVYLQRFL